MSQSLAKVNVHIVFSTKNGANIIKEQFRTELQAYFVGVLSKLGSYTEELYCNPDHIHILCTLPRTITIAQLVSKIKTSTSKWLKKKGSLNFSWQDGYAIFSVSTSKLPVVKKYIQNQAIHHNNKPFKEELRLFFSEYGVEYDERYVWD
jgi:REP element-mobilizing transposase RayT